MGVINVTPDSFSGDGVMDDPDGVGIRARRMVEEGADIIDVGGESTRPGAHAIPAEEELRRVLPAVDSIVRTVDVPVSIDTSKSSVARAALERGAAVVNDVSGAADAHLLEVVARAGAGLAIVHRGNPEPGLDLMGEIVDALGRELARAVEAGVERDRIVLDPGLGIGKDWRANLAIVRDLSALRCFTLPILVGPSRKGTIGRVLKVPVNDRLEGTAALVALCIAGGADIIRVHDVRAMARVARMTDALCREVTN